MLNLSEHFDWRILRGRESEKSKRSGVDSEIQIEANLEIAMTKQPNALLHLTGLPTAVDIADSYGSNS